MSLLSIFFSPPLPLVTYHAILHKHIIAVQKQMIFKLKSFVLSLKIVTLAKLCGVTLLVITSPPPPPFQE